MADEQKPSTVVGRHAASLAPDYVAYLREVAKEMAADVPRLQLPSLVADKFPSVTNTIKSSAVAFYPIDTIPSPTETPPPTPALAPASRHVSNSPRSEVPSKTPFVIDLTGDDPPQSEFTRSSLALTTVDSPIIKSSGKEVPSTSCSVPPRSSAAKRSGPFVDAAVAAGDFQTFLRTKDPAAAINKIDFDDVGSDVARVVGKNRYLKEVVDMISQLAESKLRELTTLIKWLNRVPVDPAIWTTLKGTVPQLREIRARILYTSGDPEEIQAAANAVDVLRKKWAEQQRALGSCENLNEVNKRKLTGKRSISLATVKQPPERNSPKLAAVMKHSTAVPPGTGVEGITAAGESDVVPALAEPRGVKRSMRTIELNTPTGVSLLNHCSRAPSQLRKRV
mmetsp:Transcript_7594/g.18720  ORF Transcript_7594/g.18720 Transcript_7594/m.18720 type:complete len:394 (-) Transcript_7594:250-1431(-)